MVDAKKHKIYSYPWRSLEKDLRQRSNKLPLVVYGSLVSSKSSSETIQDKESTRRYPVVVFGFKRIFNYEMPLDGGRYGPPNSAHSRAALNVMPTGNIQDVVNGVLLDISLRDISPTRRRELGYDLVPVVGLKWRGAEGGPFLAYILSCPNEMREGRNRTSSQIEPHREYYKVCRKGASNLGKDFLNLWLATTYLSDGISTVGIWEKTAFQR